MPRVDRKYVKLSIVGLAAVALVVGLSVGLTRGRSNKNASAAAASGGSGVSVAAVDECYSGESGKSGSRGNFTGKAAKSSSAKAAKSARKLVVPGTEDYLLDNEEAGEATDGHRRKLRNELVRELQNNETDSRSGKAAKSASSSSKAAKSAGSGKSGKSGSRGNATYCEPLLRDICDTNFTYSGKGGKSGSDSGKSGKRGGGSGSGKSGKSGGRLVNGTRVPTNSGYYYSGKGGKSGSYGRIVNGTCDCSAGSGKSGKSGSVGGSGKSGKSGSFNINMTGTNFTSSGKSGKSGSIGGSGKSAKSVSVVAPDNRCSCGGPPTVCTPSCTCETRDFIFDQKFKVCRRSPCNETLTHKNTTHPDVTIKNTTYPSGNKCCNGKEAAALKLTNCVTIDACSQCTCNANPWYRYVTKGVRECRQFDCQAPIEPESVGVYDTEAECCDGDLKCIGLTKCKPTKLVLDPTPFPSPFPTPQPVPTIITPPEPTPKPTPENTAGSTTTVSTEATGPPTTENRKDYEDEDEDEDV